MHPKCQHGNRDATRLQAALRCCARTRRGTPCRSPATHGRARCRMHGGARGSGAPHGQANGSWKHGHHSTTSISARLAIQHWLQELATFSSRLS
ncbi:MAG: HGGxSTG domain-containing protein [Hyphomicrobiaceae bacterium]